MPTQRVGITIRDFQVFVDGSPPFETKKATEGGSSPNVFKELQILDTFIFKKGRTYQRIKKHMISKYL
jgi:hypothetical protein